MKPHLLPVESIIVGERFRKEYGDVEELAESIATHGLLQPIGINCNRELMFGGRRFKAMTEVLEWKEVPVILADETGSEIKLRMIELEENVRRKDMTWKEKVCSIAEVHRLHGTESAKKGSKWTQEQTGQLLGVSTGNVSYAVQVARRLKSDDDPVQECESLTDAIRFMLKEKEEAASRRLVALSMAKSAVPMPPEALSNELNKLVPHDQTTMAPPNIPDQDACVSCEGTGVSSKGEVCPICRGTGGGPSEAGQTINIPLSSMLFNANSLEWLADKSEMFDHIITDPPYAIDMDNLDQDDGNEGFKNLEQTTSEHKVEENLQLLQKFIPLAHIALRDKGFLVMWCDHMHFRWLVDEAQKNGFRAQRWPLTWVKIHRCMNRAAGSNFTKTTEIAVVLSKGSSATLVRPQLQCHHIGDRASAKIFNHPFAKPWDLWQWVIEAVALPGQTILDPFAGAGSCVYAAAKAGFKPVGVELVKEHYNRMVTVLQDAYTNWMAPKKVRFK